MASSIRRSDETGAPSLVASREDALVELTRNLRLEFVAAREEVFHDGVESRLGAAIISAVTTEGALALVALEEVMREREDDVEALEETCRQLGLVRGASTHDARLRLLGRLLESPQPRVRDAASIGLALMRDAEALPYLQRALGRESQAWVRESLALAIADLKPRA